MINIKQHRISTDHPETWELWGKSGWVVGDKHFYGYSFDLNGEEFGQYMTSEEPLPDEAWKKVLMWAYEETRIEMDGLKIKGEQTQEEEESREKRRKFYGDEFKLALGEKAQ